MCAKPVAGWRQIKIVPIDNMPNVKSAIAMSSYGVYGEYADHVKNDFQNAKKRNLHCWTRWRTKLNDNLVDSVLKGSELTTVESFGEFIAHEVPDPNHPTTNPKTLLAYSASHNSTTNLASNDFVKYGIPRARVDEKDLWGIRRMNSEPGHDVADVRDVTSTVGSTVDICDRPVLDWTRSRQNSKTSKLDPSSTTSRLDLSSTTSRLDLNSTTSRPDLDSTSSKSRPAKRSAVRTLAMCEESLHSVNPQRNFWQSTSQISRQNSAPASNIKFHYKLPESQTRSTGDINKLLRSVWMFDEL